jgi:hypothetical protein
MGMKIVDLEQEVVIQAVGEIPKESKIFRNDHARYVDALTGQILLNDLKGRLLNIAEGIGLPERQEIAIKRMITNALHDAHKEINKSLAIVVEEET